MRLKISIISMCVALTASFAHGEEGEALELSAAKDNFGRSNKRTRNNGASEQLLVAYNSSVRSLVAFDFSEVTNEIVSAEFTFRAGNTAQTAPRLTIAPMVHTPNNAAWVEGEGALGSRGQNARLGEATFQWRSFRDAPWENRGKKPVVNLMDGQLWDAPIGEVSATKWTEGVWFTVPVDDARLLEAIRLSEDPTITFGIWGTSGSELYAISSKESGHAPKLRLKLKPAPKKP